MTRSIALMLVVLCGLSSACRPGSSTDKTAGDPALLGSPALLSATMHLVEDGGQIVVELQDIPLRTLELLRANPLPQEAWEALFSIYAHDALTADADVHPVRGRYRITGYAVRFEPRYPFAPGTSYLARLERGSDREEMVFVMPRAEPGEPARVISVFPGADTLPANLLKFYIQFSRPMQAGQAYERLSLVDLATGEPVYGPFVVLDPELWDPDQRRLTVLFDPGRIKRDVGINLELGPPLEAGKSYRLVVDPAWPDAVGRPMGEGYTRTFHVVAADRVQPDVATWQFDPPAAGTRDPLAIRFPEPLDYALLQRLLRVRDATERAVRGDIALTDRERGWAFTPETPWRAGRYTLEVETILEDLAGNTLRSVFDVDLRDAPPSEEREAETVRRLTFEIAPVPDPASPASE
ncbi:MAG: hypothetical protein R2834_12995 [Rhodothermales bacterium]